MSYEFTKALTAMEIIKKSENVEDFIKTIDGLELSEPFTDKIISSGHLRTAEIFAAFFGKTTKEFINYHLAYGLQRELDALINTKQ